MRANDIAGTSAFKNPATARPADGDSPERRAQLDRVIALERSVAQAQEAALAGLEEREYPSALAGLAESQREAITAAALARNELLNPPQVEGDPVPAAAAEPLQVRFNAVRQAIIEDGLSIEEAETRFEAARAGP